MGSLQQIMARFNTVWLYFCLHRHTKKTVNRLIREDSDAYVKEKGTNAVMKP